jgi:Tol biopolymer transport system component
MTVLPPARIRRVVTALLSTAAVFGALAVTVVHAQYFGRNKIQYENFDWQILNTPHFEIFFYPQEEDLAARAAVVAEDAYDRLSGILGQRIPFVLYASPNDFQQTNIADGLIGESTGGFSEPMRNRVVLPYPGDSAGFVHVVNHELVHVFMFDIVFGSTRSGGARTRWFQVPLWFAEGMAEWFSSGWDQQADMWIRDATVYDWIAPLDRIYGGFQVYKEGQAALRYVAETYGEPKVVELFKALGRTRDVERAVQQTIGLSTKELSEAWVKNLKKEYWPLYGSKQDPEDLGRRLTDHWEKGAYFFQQPSLSPDGRYLAMFSDYDGLVDLYLMDAIEGKVLRKLVTGYRSNRFLTLHSFESSIGFSPDSKRIAFIAKAGRDEHLYVVDVASGEVRRDIPLRMDIARSPAWSPIDDRVVLSGTRGGTTDLYLVDLDAGSIQAVTHDILDEHSPAWYPDGRRLLYSAHPSATENLEFTRDEDGTLRLDGDQLRRPELVKATNGFDIYSLDLSGGPAQIVVGTPGADEGPVAVDDSTIVFVSDWTGVSNLYTHNQTTGETRRLSDVLGGVFQPSLSRQADRLAYTAFTHAGFDIFIKENFTEFSEKADYPRVASTNLMAVPPRPRPKPAPLVGPTGPGEGTPDLESAALNEIEKVAAARPNPVPLAAVRPDSVEPGSPPPEETSADEPVERPNVDSLVQAAEAVADSAGAGDSSVGTVEPYHLRFSMDPLSGYGGGGVFYSQGLGFGAAQRISFSDLLGNHRMSFLVNFYGSLKNSDLAASYTYLKRRVNLSGGVFHYRNILNSNFTSIGEVYSDNRLFTERNYGVFGLASYPITQFNRFDLELSAFVSDKRFYEYSPVTGYYEQVGGRQKDKLVQPSLSYVHDSTFYGQTGPVTGSRYQISFSPAIPVGGEEGVDRTTTFVDYRRYFHLWDRNSLALRLVGAQSVGAQPRLFVIGGPQTLRGWDIYDFEKVNFDGSPQHPNLVGSKMFLMNLEYRFPFVDALILGWPGRFGIGGISGAVFFDTGSAFNDHFRFFDHTESGAWRLRDLKADFGFGIRANIGFLPLRFDWAWRTDLAETSDAIRYSFSIGPSF